MESEMLNKLSAFIEENKGKRKFTQSVDLAINFTNIDFSKQENKLNLDVNLPNGRGKALNVIVFADEKRIVDAAAAAGAKVIPGAQIQSMANDKSALNELLGSTLLAQPSLMPQIARSLGSFLGPRNRIPKPLIGSDISTAIGAASSTITLRSKGKNLPTAHCSVGTESMPVDKIAANVDAVFNTVAKKVGKQNIKSMYIKMTMSKPLRLI
ncbi:MAG: hypothetical protein M1500_03930 [Candidatus Marsarchaeota archaeon]|jgi:large subunit ribosomal protein L1|nr:hypothetical protein [Candidatus Marsarchaeota archaeon]MCL5112824.1 hypothetical protein [Candidatus Marsarchaeota archaeon]